MTTEPMSESYDQFVERTVSAATNQFYAEVRKEMIEVLNKAKFNIENLEQSKGTIRFNCDNIIRWKVLEGFSSFLEKGGEVDGNRKTVKKNLLAKISSEIGPKYNREFALETERMVQIIALIEYEMKSIIMNGRNEVLRQLNGMGAAEMGSVWSETGQEVDFTEATASVMDQVSQEEQYSSLQKQKETIEILKILTPLKIKTLIDDALNGLLKLPGIRENVASVAIIARLFSAFSYKTDFNKITISTDMSDQQETAAIELVEDIFNGHRFLLPAEPEPGDLVIPTGGFEMCRCAPECPFESRQIAYRRVDENFR